MKDKRSFDFIKYMEIKVNENYKSIRTININSSIKHGFEDNELSLRIIGSGYNSKKMVKKIFKV